QSRHPVRARRAPAVASRRHTARQPLRPTMRDRTARQQPTKRNLAEWDAEIEEEFQSVVAATKTAGRKKRGQRLVGAPLAFLADVCRSTKGRAPLVVAMLIYRRTCVCGSRTVTLPGAELAELGISREMKRKALA